MSNFQEMADLVLEQLNLIEKLMTGEDENENKRSDNQNKPE